MKKKPHYLAIVLSLLIITSVASIITSIAFYGSAYGVAPSFFLAIPAMLFAIIFSLYILSDIFPDMFGKSYFKRLALKNIHRAFEFKDEEHQLCRVLEEIAIQDAALSKVRIRSFLKLIKMPLKRYALDGLRPHSAREMESMALSNLVSALNDYERGDFEPCKFADYAAELVAAHSEKDNETAYVKYIRGTPDEHFALAIIFLLKAYIKKGTPPEVELSSPRNIKGEDFGVSLRKIISKIAIAYSAESTTADTQRAYLAAVFDIAHLCSHHGMRISFIVAETIKHSL